MTCSTIPRIALAVVLGTAIGPGHIGFAQGVAPPPDQSGKTVRLLTVGNSFSGNATHFLGDLAAAAGHKLVFRRTGHRRRLHGPALGKGPAVREGPAG